MTAPLEEFEPLGDVCAFHNLEGCTVCRIRLLGWTRPGDG